MKVQLNLSIDIDTAKQVEEMKRKGTMPSRLFTRVMNKFAENDFKLPLTIKEDVPVI